ncbi:MAG: hypothetical protein WAM82_01565 [Thermoanaerobaculia bacterium]
MKNIDPKYLLNLFSLYGQGEFINGARRVLEFPGDIVRPYTIAANFPFTEVETQRMADMFEEIGLSHSACLLRDWHRLKLTSDTFFPELQRRIRHELESVLWLHVSHDRSKYYLEAQDGFGESVATAFCSVSYNVEEASKCFALGRYTACVFHLMCILEVGLDSLAHALALPYSQKNWNEILKTIEAAIVAIVPGSTPTWKDDKEFYSTAALEFKFFRDAWRNHVAHGRARYGDEEAGRIVEHVEAFMQHLATRLKERP